MARVRESYDKAAQTFVEVCRGAGPESWGRPGLDAWTVRDLVGHTSRALSTVGSYLDAGRGKAVALRDPLEYYAVLKKAYADPAQIDERARQAGIALGAEPLATVSALARDAVARVGASSDDAPVETPAGVMRLLDYLPSRIFELVVHTADIAVALGVRYAPWPGALIVSWELVARLAASRSDPITPLLAMTGRCALPAGFTVV